MKLFVTFLYASRINEATFELYLAILDRRASKATFLCYY
jgi:hypothetical protein